MRRVVISLILTITTQMPGLRAEQARPQRIVSASLASDEILLELLRGQQRGRILALSALADDLEYSNVVAEAKSVLRRYSGQDDSLWLQAPDLVLLPSTARPEVKLRLQQLGLRFETLLAVDGFGAIRDNIQRIAAAIGEDVAGQELLTRFDAELAALRLKSTATRNCRRLLNYAADGLLMGAHTSFDDIVTLAGAENLAASKLKIDGWRMVGAESLLAAAPEVLVIASECRSLPTDTLARVPWALLPAVQQRRVVLIPGRQLLAASQYVLGAVQTLSSELNKLSGCH